MNSGKGFSSKPKPVSLQIQRIQVTREPEGISCCGVCRICTCIKWGFLLSPLGAIKLAQFVFALLCQLLLYFFGQKHSFQMSGGGATYFIFFTVSSGCLLNSMTLIATYVLSPRAKAMIRPTIFEILFCGIAFTLYVIASCFLAVTSQKLFYYDGITPETFHAMTATYVMGFLAALTHLLDGGLAFRDYRRVRVIQK